MALLLSRRGVPAAGGAEHQQGVGGAGEHVAGERGDHLRRADHGAPGQSPRPALAADPAGTGLRDAARRGPGPVLRGSGALRLPALRHQGTAGGGADHAPDAVQRDRLRASLRRR